MAVFYINTDNIKEYLPLLSAGDEVLLTGTVYTARDAAHKKLVKMLENGEKLPFDLDGSIIYYSGPTPAKNGLPIGSCGPTTSSRMDVFTPALLENGLCAMIGKGPRSSAVCKSIIENDAVYFCAIGGAGALYAKSVKKLEVIAFDELGCESVKKLTVENFPLLCGIDSKGGTLFK